MADSDTRECEGQKMSRLYWEDENASLQSEDEVEYASRSGDVYPSPALCGPSIMAFKSVV